MIDRKPRVYIAGPMRGIEFYNFPAFDAARDRLIAQGFEVVSPADMDREAGLEPWVIKEKHKPSKLRQLLDVLDPTSSLVSEIRDRRCWANTPADFDLDAARRRDVQSIMQCQCIYLLHGWENSNGAQVERAVAKWLGLTVMLEG